MSKHLPQLSRKPRFRMVREDIAAAKCNSRTDCAAAICIRRVLGFDVGRVRVSTQGVSIAKDDYRYYFAMPMPACRLVRDFDKGLKVEPITFVLKYTHRRKITPVPEERKAQVNAARKRREETLRDLGRSPKKYPGRYGI